MYLDLKSENEGSGDPEKKGKDVFVLSVSTPWLTKNITSNHCMSDRCLSVCCVCVIRAVMSILNHKLHVTDIDVTGY
jgi:hypothetical protein